MLQHENWIARSCLTNYAAPKIIGRFWLHRTLVGDFSCFNSSGIRSSSNVGFLAAYVVGITSPFFVGPMPEVVTWLVMGVVGGLLYFLWALWAYLAGGRKAGDQFPSPIALVHGLFLWPVMIPEAVEYVGAEVGLLKVEKFEDPDSK